MEKGETQLGGAKVRVLFEIGHPAQVHLFKYTIRELELRGHKIKISIREREGVVSHLLDIYGLRYESMKPTAQGMVGKAITMIKNDMALLKIAKRFKPDLFVSAASPYSAHVSGILGAPHIALEDTEDAIRLLVVPFTRTILTPDCFLKQFPPRKHIRYPGYHELAYLHPNRFKPDPSILEYLGVEKDERYVIMRFSAWDASHDIGHIGFKSMEERMKFVETLEQYGRVFITSEIPLPKSLEEKVLRISIEKIHDILYYATMYVGGGATLASEAGVLGVPWIWISGGERLGYLDDQEKNYGLGYCLETPQQALEKAVKLLKREDLKSEWEKKRQKLLNRKIDVTAFMIWFIENYPESIKIIKENPDYQERFR